MTQENLLKKKIIRIKNFWFNYGSDIKSLLIKVIIWSVIVYLIYLMVTAPVDSEFLTINISGNISGCN